MKKILKSIALILSVGILSLPLNIFAVETRELAQFTSVDSVILYSNSEVLCKTANDYIFNEEDFPDCNIEKTSERYSVNGDIKDLIGYSVSFETFVDAFEFIDIAATNENIVSAEIETVMTVVGNMEAHIEGDELVFDGYLRIDENNQPYYYIPEDIEVTRVKIPDIREIIAAEKASFDTLRYGYVCDSETIGIGDVILLSKHVSKKLTLPADSQNYKNANCDLRDNAVNADDLKAMIDYLLGTIDSLPVR